MARIVAPDAIGAVRSQHADAATAVLPETEDAFALGDRDPGVGTRTRSKRLRNRLARLGTSCMHHTSARVTAFLAEVVVELDSELDKVGNPGRCLVAQRPNGAVAAEPPPRPQRVGCVQARVVAVPDRRGNAALGEIAVRGEHRPARKE